MSVQVSRHLEWIQPYRRTGANDRGEIIGNVRPAGDGLKRDVVVNGIVSKELRQLDDLLVFRPRYAEPAY
jgi:hypothetical protein